MHQLYVWVIKRPFPAYTVVSGEKRRKSESKNNDEVPVIYCYAK
jgi:hypothetical protein